MKTIVVLVSLVVANAASAQGDARESRTVQTAQGPVRGYKTVGEDIFFFYGIPYATAPTGKQKFTAPLPEPMWKETFEAVVSNIICPQIKRSFVNRDDTRENCLVANAYVPDTNQTNLPVVVYVHGGGFEIGFGELMQPKSMVKSKKVVAVTFNYRLGAHGFLCLGTEGAPGNAGMKDQVALLRWVKNNIANFGGNPDDVTITGYSAGSSSVELIMLSKMTNGLFNKVIPESGASVGVWSVQLEPIEHAKDFAKRLNFTNVEDIYALEEFYTSMSYDDLTLDLFSDNTDSTFSFSPCIERDLGTEIFLDDAPVNILKQGKYRKVPVLYGFSSMEGFFRIDKFTQWKDLMNKQFADFLPADLKFKNVEEREKVARTVKEFYFGNETVSDRTIQKFIDYFSDIMFIYPHLRSVKLQVESGSRFLYLYEFSFDRPYLANKGLKDTIGKISGAGHCAQTMSILESPTEDVFSNYNAEIFKNVQERMVDIWLNFIISGKPVADESNYPLWPPVGVNLSPHMNLGEEMILKELFEAKRTRFWEDIYDQYYKMPVAPSLPKVLSKV